MQYRILSRVSLLALAFVVVLAGCDSGNDNNDTNPISGKIAYVTRNASNQVILTAGNLDGTGHASLSIANIQEAIRRKRQANPQGGDSTIVVPLPTSSNVVAMNDVRWSPDGQRLALVVSTVANKSEVIILNISGGGGQTASPETLSVGNVAWSPSGNRIAYTLGASGATQVQLYTTDLQTNAVQSVLPAEPLPAGSVIAWDQNGQGIFYSVPGAGATDKLKYVAVGTGASSDRVASVSGVISDIDPVLGGFLVRRPYAASGSTPAGVDLIEQNINGGTEGKLITGAYVSGARYAIHANGTYALVYAGTSNTETSQLGYLYSFIDNLLYGLNLSSRYPASVYID